MGMGNTVRTAALVAALAAAPAAAEQHEMEAPDATAAAPHEMEAPDATAPAPAENPAAAEAEAPIRGTVTRAQFTSAVVDREPTDAVEQVSNDQHRIYFFTELQGFQGQDLVHRWEHAGEVKAEVPFGVAGPRWRVYSSKSLDPSWLGTWTVSVVDAEGNVAASESFEYVAAPKLSASEKPPTPTPPGPASYGHADEMDRGDSDLESR
jgi:hypothetical protein